MSNQLQKTMPAPRERKYKKIITILQDFLGSDFSEYTCLDVGCSEGGITNFIADHFGTTIGIDIDKEAVNSAMKNRRSSSTSYSYANGSRLPFSNDVFDVIICAQVYEHTLQKQSLADEIWRTLRPGGVCFFSGPNRLAIMEEHYWLPFLSWFPRTIGNYYMQIFNRGTEYDAYPLFYWQIRKLWQHFIIHDYTTRMITEPEFFAIDDRFGKYSFLKNIPSAILRASTPFYPNYNWILQKPDTNQVHNQSKYNNRYTSV
jgi:SAM-dependent methyltransferase